MILIMLIEKACACLKNSGNLKYGTSRNNQGFRFPLSIKIVVIHLTPYQVCIMDNRGHGESRGTNFYLRYTCSNFIVYGTISDVLQHSTTTFAWDCFELLTHLRWDDVHIVGLSMGTSSLPHLPCQI